MKRFSFFLALMVGIGIILLANSTTTFAQGETGSVTGVVTDSQGGTVAGADVTLTDVATNLPKTTVTNESGRYHFAAVPAGLYDITISKAGKMAIVSGLRCMGSHEDLETAAYVSHICSGKRITMEVRGDAL